MAIQLGLCCMVTELRDSKPPIFPSRRVVIKTVEEKGIDVLKEKIVQNLEDTLTILDWCHKNNIRVYRMSSELFPHKSNPKVENYDFDFAMPLLKAIGQKSKNLGIRLTFHPGQYNVVGTPIKCAFDQTIADLSYHAQVMDHMELGVDSVMVVHGGGIYGDKQATMERWCTQYKVLPDCIKRRLVLENCERCFSIKDCLWVSSQIGIPVVMDSHHHDCYQKLHPLESLEEGGYYMGDVMQTWIKRGIKPKVHVSEQGSGRCGHHSDYIEELPNYFLEIPQKYDISLDIMIEAKMKEKAIMRLYKKYGSQVIPVKKKKRNYRLVIV